MIQTKKIGKGQERGTGRNRKTGRKKIPLIVPKKNSNFIFNDPDNKSEKGRKREQ